MKSSKYTCLLFCQLVSLVFMVGCGSPEREVPSGRFEITGAWARTASRSMTSGAYLTIINGTDRTDTLVSVASNAAVSTEIHESFRTEEGMSGMRPAGDLLVAAGSSLELEPGGLHIMLMGLKRDLAGGDTITVTLHFSGTESRTVDFPVYERR